jgi:hypothetical protein
MINALIEDIKALYRNDPAAKNIEFILYQGLHGNNNAQGCSFSI